MPRTRQAFKSLQRNRSISPYGIRAGGSPHACPCRKPSQGWGWHTGGGPPNSRLHLSLDNIPSHPVRWDLRHMPNTVSQAASSRGAKKSVVYSTHPGWVLHDFDPPGSWRCLREATTDLPTRMRGKVKGKGERLGPGAGVEPAGRFRWVSSCEDCTPGPADSQVVGVHGMGHVCTDHVGLGDGFLEGRQVLE